MGGDLCFSAALCWTSRMMPGLGPDREGAGLQFQAISRRDLEGYRGRGRFKN